jgi:hypothetical protein
MTENNTPKPKPKPPVGKQPKKQVTKPVETKKDEKKPFVRKPHLTQRPFSDNELFRKLREQAQPNAPRNPRRTSKKGTSK